jgi:hypothetical protein
VKKIGDLARLGPALDAGLEVAVPVVTSSVTLVESDGVIWKRRGLVNC